MTIYNHLYDADVELPSFFYRCHLIPFGWCFWASWRVIMVMNRNQYFIQFLSMSSYFGYYLLTIYSWVLCSYSWNCAFWSDLEILVSAGLFGAKQTQIRIRDGCKLHCTAQNWVELERRGNFCCVCSYSALLAIWEKGRQGLDPFARCCLLDQCLVAIFCLVADHYCNNNCAGMLSNLFNTRSIHALWALRPYVPCPHR